MKKAAKIYKNAQFKTEILSLYDQKLHSFGLDFEDVYVDTFAGKTHVVVLGKAHLPPLVVLHGINAGAPLALEPLVGLSSHYRIYGVDTVGQATKSAETRLSFSNHEYGKWLAEVLEQLNLNDIPVLAVSYGAFILNELIKYAPQKIQKAMYIVPSGFANGNFWLSTKKLTFPLFKFFFSKKEEDLIQFLDAFYTTKDAHSLALHRNLLLGVHIDYRRPPLLQKTDTKGFDKPVYALIVEDDIFFPKEKAIPRMKEVFNTIREIYLLQNAKHTPDQNRYPEIGEVIEKWLTDKV